MEKNTAMLKSSTQTPSRIALPHLRPNHALTRRCLTPHAAPPLPNSSSSQCQFAVDPASAAPRFLSSPAPHIRLSAVVASPHPYPAQRRPPPNPNRRRSTPSLSRRRRSVDSDTPPSRATPPAPLHADRLLLLCVLWSGWRLAATLNGSSLFLITTFNSTRVSSATHGGFDRFKGLICLYSDLRGPFGSCCFKTILVNMQAKVYHSFDSVDDDPHNSYPLNYLNSITPNGLPPHELIIKINCPMILLRNLDPNNGLCNGTRLMVRAFQIMQLMLRLLVDNMPAKGCSSNGSLCLPPTIYLYLSNSRGSNSQYVSVSQ
ncbi:uncharacterized protein LOC127770823 [Oryza glaberrima]|uniref:uncharacterized protein LOC127770823 n=1 Tax=Oryza glaberrima TaxID=4538 RepID=UPI00224BFCE8|nr:uncharacterized protein LOC127770823 [Oryza glaberrima]